MAAVEVSDVQQLVEMARDKSAEGRSRLVAAIGDLYFGEHQLLSAHDRQQMTVIIARIIHDVEMSVRRALSESFAKQPDAPRDLVLTLANNEIEVAYPVLVKSPVLQDAELIEIVQHRTMEHQVAIAMRPMVSEPLSDALVETGSEEVIVTLLENPNARISTQTMGYLVAQSDQVESYQEPLVRRHDLSAELAKKLYWGVSAALRTHIVENFDIDPGELDETIESAVTGLLTEEKRVKEKSEPEARTEADDAKNLALLMETLKQGEVSTFVHIFGQVSGLRRTLLRRFLFEPGGEALGITCKAVGLDKHAFVFIFLRFRAGRLGDKQVDQDELTRALTFYDGVTGDAANALVRRWQRDSDYMNALRLIEQARG